MICALISAMSALFFGLFMPYAGWNEAILIALVGAALLVAVSRGYIAIRRGFVAAHREWMLRSFAIGLGISTARVFALALDLPGIDATPREIFVISIWSGWIFTLAVTEIWIRVTRAAPLLSRLSSRAAETARDPDVRADASYQSAARSSHSGST